MSPLPKHNWGFIVLNSRGQPIADNGQGMFVGMSYGEVFLDRKCAEWVKRKEQKFLREFGIQIPEKRAEYERDAKKVRIIRAYGRGDYDLVQRYAKNS